MMNWREFHRAAPELAALGARLFERSGVALIGTTRKDGSPRISPVEPLLADGELYLGMMWQSLKARDLLRDPRCTIHSSVSDRTAADGEFKLHGRALDIQHPEQRHRYTELLYEKIGWKPEEPTFHLFAVDVQSAGFFTTQADTRIMKRWKTDEGIEEFRQDVGGQWVRQPPTMR